MTTAGSRGEDLAAEIDALVTRRGYEWYVELTAGTECFWACKLTVVLTPNREDGPDRSLVTKATGGQGPEDVLQSAWDDMRAWLDQLGKRAGQVKAARARIAARAGGEVDTGT